MAKPQPAALDAVAAYAAQQDGYFTTAQARAAGVDDARLVRLVQDGYLERVMHRVYRVAIGTPINSRVRADLFVRYLALDDKRTPWRSATPRVVASHASAADLLGIGNLPADEAAFTSATRRTTTNGARIYVAGLPDVDWEWMERGRIPVTTPARTIVDLAVIHTGRDYVERAIADAVRRRIVTPEALEDVVIRRRRPSVAWTAEYARSRT